MARRGLVRRIREFHLTQRERDAAEALGRQREHARLANRPDTRQAESRRDRWSSYGGGGA